MEDRKKGQKVEEERKPQHRNFFEDVLTTGKSHFQSQIWFQGPT
jgi:hypothetical protein